MTIYLERSAESLANDPAFADRYAPLHRIAQAVATEGLEIVTFLDIPQTFDDLVLSWVAKGATSTGGILVRFNGDSGPNYDIVDIARIGTDGMGQGGGGFEGVTGITIGSVGDVGGRGTATFPMYTAGLAYQTALAQHFVARTTSPFGLHYLRAGHRRSTDAITRIDVIANFAGYFAAGSTFTLFGRR